MAGNSLLHAQDCKSVRTGTFRIVAEIDTLKIETIITRTGDYQIEDVPSQGIKMQFEVKWTSGCSYELHKPKILKGNLDNVSEDQILYVKIIKVTPEFYTAELSANFADAKFTKDIEIIKKSEIK